MAEIARWGKKKWQVTESNISAIENLSFRYQQVADNNTSTEEKQVTNQRGKELVPLTFATTLVRTSQLDIRKEIEEWESLVTKVDYFYLGGKLLGSALQLRKVEVSDVKLDNSGNIYYAKLSFEFKEYEKETTSVKSEVPALQVTASSQDKELKKTENKELENADVNSIKIGDWVNILVDYYVDGTPITDQTKDFGLMVLGIEGDKYIMGYKGSDGSKLYLRANDISLK